MSEKECITLIRWGIAFLMVAAMCATGCDLYQKKLAFENGYEQQVLPGKSDFAWVKRQ